VERCAVLVHVLDCAAPAQDPDRDPVADYEVIEAELAAYEDDTGADLSGRPRIIALNKVDVPEAREIASQARQAFTDRGLAVYEVSAATREGVRELSYALAAVVAEVRAAAPAAEPSRVVIRPQPASGADFEIQRTGENTFLVRGDKPWRWVQQTDFSNDEAVGYLADRLAKLGVEEALTEAGADDGAEVLIGNGDDAVVFDWAPDVPAGPQRGRGPRGTDRRLSR
jgi:GTP-binding protein